MSNRYSTFLANLALLFCLEAYDPETLDKDIIIESEIKSDIEDLEIDIPEVSGQIWNLPWSNDVKFLEAQKEHNTPVLLSAYCTVLKDPLPGEEYNVHLAADFLAGTVLEPGEVFSQNKLLGPYDEEKGYQKGPTYIGANLTTTIGGGVCKISSTLYNVSILSDLEIVERHNHSMPVPYVPYGQDATVAYGVKDFKFKNNTDSPILIWAKGIDNRLYIAFYGSQGPPEVEWQHDISNVVEAPRYYKENPELKEGEEKIIVEGMDGATVESSVIIRDKDGNVKTKKLRSSYYIPMPYVIEIGK